MKSLPKIFIAFTAVFLLPKLLKGNPTEEPSNFVDVPIVTVTPSPMGDPSLVPSFCMMNYAEDANTTNFSLSEFHSKDGTLVPKELRGHVQILMQQLEIIRAEVNLRMGTSSPTIINSGYRSPQHNQAVGGVSNSKHVCGMASDFIMPGIDNSLIQDVVLQLIQEGKVIDGGLGRYNTFTHYDIGDSRRWDKR